MVAAMCCTDTMTGQTIAIDSGHISLMLQLRDREALIMTISPVTATSLAPPPAW